MSDPKPTCAKCGAEFDPPDPSKGGRPPKYCPLHRKQRGKPLDPQSVAVRRNTRRNTQRAAKHAQEESRDLYLAAQLRIALGLYSDPEVAARYLGIPSADRARIIDLVKDGAGKLPRSSIADAQTRIALQVAMLAETVVHHRESISPRDLAHVTKALATARNLLTDQSTSQYATVNVSIGGLPSGEDDSDLK